MEPYAHNKENQQTRERNPKTLYSPGAINGQVFFPGDSGAETTFIVTRYILSHGAANTGPGRQSKQAVQTI